jgi:hypothetical protein
MKYSEVFEARRNPEQNIKLGIVDFLRQYKDRDDIYIHSTDVLKVGIYPRTSDGQDSPVGIYAFRLKDIWADDIERWNTGEYKRGLEFLSYHGGNHIFVLQSDIDTDFPKDYTQENLDIDCGKMKTLFGLSDENIKRLLRVAKSNQNFRDIPAGYFWGMVKAFISGVSEFDQYTYVDCKKWNYVLRKLGYLGFNDPGYGVIHGAEPCQALFLTTSAFKVVDHSLINQKQKEVDVGTYDKREIYKGGRLPKNLVMNGIPNTLFHNYTPSDFKNVHTWTVKGMSLRDYYSFIRFVPWNGIGIIDNMTLDGDFDNSYSMRESEKFLQSNIPKNIKIKNIYIGGRQPVLLLRKMPIDFPVENIKTAMPIGEVYLQTLPDEIKNKLRGSTYA